jgi:hypothetical protein
MTATTEAAEAPVTAAAAPANDRRTIWLFVAIALVMGTFFVLATPALTGYDEPYHFVRAWELSSGQVHSTAIVHANGQKDLGAYFPQTLAPLLTDILRDGYYHGISPSCRGESAACAFKRIGDPTPSGPPEFLGFAPSAVYAPVPYIPAATGIRVGRWLGLSVLAMTLLARFLGLLAYVAIVAFALVRMPRWRVVLAVVALTPVCMFQAATISADGVTIALAFLAIALAMRLAQTDPGLSPTRALLEVGALGIALGLAKPPYIVFALLFLPAVIRHRHTILGRMLPVAFLPGLVLFAWWSRYAQSVWLPPTNPYAAPGVKIGYGLRDVDQVAQLHYVAHHPFHFIGAFGTTISNTWRTLLHDAVAQAPGWRLALLPALSVALLSYAAILVAAVQAAAARRRDESRSERLELATNIVVAFGTFVGLFLLAYTGWNAVGAPRIDAFQGRYLIPVLAILSVGIAPHVPVPQRAMSDGGMSTRADAVWTWTPWVFVTAALVLTAVSLVVHYY